MRDFLAGVDTDFDRHAVERRNDMGQAVAVHADLTGQTQDLRDAGRGRSLYLNTGLAHVFVTHVHTGFFLRVTELVLLALMGHCDLHLEGMGFDNLGSAAQVICARRKLNALRLLSQSIQLNSDFGCSRRQWLII